MLLFKKKKEKRMAVPSFGVSQRVEICPSYLRYNSPTIAASLGLTSNLLHAPVDPKDNVAESGQVVLLQNYAKGDSNYERLEVIPDAAGFHTNFNPKAVSSGQLQSLLESEIKTYQVGVNQVEKGVGVAHAATGYGWDISLTPGQPATILHTGSEPINRFDYVAVRFPLQEDIRSQAEVWHQKRNHSGPSICKFATYPIRENWDMLKYLRFYYDADALRTQLEVDCYVDNDGGGGGGGKDHFAAMKYDQFPALFKLVGKVIEAYHESSEEVQQEMRNCIKKHVDVVTSPMLIQDAGFLTTLQFAKAAVAFSDSLRPPVVLARCLDFDCAQPHLKGHAECGDMMKCILV